MTPDPLFHAPRRALQLLAPVLLPAALALGGCSQSDAGDAADTPGDFSLVVPDGRLVLIEGDADGLSIPLALERRDGHAAPVSLGVEGATPSDVASLSGSFASQVLAPGDDATRVTLHLAIADRAILPGQRRLRLSASDGAHTTRREILVEVEPVDAPDVYLLLGQSNMIGSSGEGTRRAEPGGPDEPDPRLKQLNVSSNASFGDAAAYVSPEHNVVAPSVVTAEDPLHEPINPGGESGKGAESIGLGLTFGKRALGTTSREVVLVPAAWSGSAFCDNENAPLGQWNALPPDEPVLGNTLLFDRAVVRANAALAESGGILRGILWHQGESDANLPCATLYAENLALLARELRSRIAPDARGAALRAPDAPVPFVVGTMSRGADEHGDYSGFSEAKRMVDEAHRAVASRIPHSAVSVHDDLVPANGYPCGQQDCIHFGSAALREMGLRYHDALQRSLADR